MNVISLALVTRSFYNQVWAVTPEMYGVMESIILERLEGYKPSTEEIKARVDGTTYGSDVEGTPGSEIAVVALHGVLMSRIQAMESLSGGSTPQRFASLVQAAADDPQVGTIVISVDSPGGAVSGTGVAAEAVAYAASKKRTIAVVDDSAYSAAYWLASQATEIVIPESGGVGSIGVIMAHLDRREQYAKAGVKPTVLRSGANKALGQSSEALTPAVRAKLEGDMQKYHDLFVSAVALGRGQTAEYVQTNWADGSTWLGQEAVDLGLADRIGTLASVLAELQGAEAETPPATSFSPAASAAPPGQAEQKQADSDDAPPPPGAASSSSPIQAQDAPPEESMNIAAMTAKLAANQPLTAEESAFLASHLGAATTPTPAPAATPAAAAQPAAVQPDTSAWPAEARAAFEGLSARLSATDARAVAAEQSATAERNIRLTGHFEQRAHALGQPTEFAATLRAAHDKLSKEEYEAYEAALNRGAAAASNLLDARGSSQAQSGDATSELNTRAQALMAADTRLTLAAAQQQVFAADPAFARRYNAAFHR